MQRTRFKRKIWPMCGCAAAGFILALVILILAGLTDHLGRADVGLVLGSKVESDGTPSARLRARLDRTVELYQAGYFPLVITSGGNGREGFDEAAVMKDYLVARGVPPDRVLVDSGGMTTFMSARNTLAILKLKKLSSVLVVSQYFHLPRVTLALHRFGIPTVYTAHALFFESRDVYSSARELVGYLSYLLKNYDSHAVPNV